MPIYKARRRRLAGAIAETINRGIGVYVEVWEGKMFLGHFVPAGVPDMPHPESFAGEAREEMLGTEWLNDD